MVVHRVKTTFQLILKMYMTVLNKLCIWRDSVLYLGDSLDPQMHSHHAVQCCIALEGMLDIRWDGLDGWETCHAAIIGANIYHSIKNSGAPICLLYLEKTSSDYRSIIDYHCLTPECSTRQVPLLLRDPIPEKLSKMLQGAMSHELNVKEANAIRQKCLELFHGLIANPQALDSRISKLLTHIHEHPGELFKGEILADISCLSESRMQHLFKQQVGIPIRRYMLWARLRHVVDLALAGASLTTAAYEAGFSDSAHFSRTFKAMFGIPPSLLLTAGIGLTPLVCE